MRGLCRLLLARLARTLAHTACATCAAFKALPGTGRDRSAPAQRRPGPGRTCECEHSACMGLYG
eukprot:7353379-Heterocapsa_arctica.AAC.1